MESPLFQSTRFRLLNGDKKTLIFINLLPGMIRDTPELNIIVGIVK